MAFLPRRSPTKKKEEKENKGKKDRQKEEEKGEVEIWERESDGKYIERGVELELEAVTGRVLVAHFLRTG